MGFFINKSFQFKLILFFAVLVTFVQIVTFVAVYSITRRNVSSQIETQLLKASRSIHLQLEDRVRILAREAHVLAADFGFREAVGTDSKLTILSALENLTRRIDADRMLLISMEDEIIVDTQNRKIESRPFPYADVMIKAEENDQAVSMLVLDNTIYEFVVVPVLAPVPIGWIGIGKTVDDRLVAEIKARSSIDLDVSFAFRNASKQWFVPASTLNPSIKPSLISILQETRLLWNRPLEINIKGKPYIAVARLLDAPTESDPIAAILKHDLDEALKPFQPMLFGLLALAVISLSLSLFGGVLIARSVTKPVHVLSKAAQRIQNGNYAEEVKLVQQDELGQLAEVFNHMMAGIKEREEKILFQAHHDTLTGLPNRIKYESQLKAAIQVAEKGTQVINIILIGVDRFSDINNTLGHRVGDSLIQLIGNRLQKQFSQTDVISRLASDEYILILPSIPQAELDVIIRQIIDSFEVPFSIDLMNIDVTVHLGIAIYPFHGTAVRTLMQHAEVAMAEARRSAHNRFAFYDTEKDPYRSELLSLMGELREGIGKGELELYFQPKINLQSSQISHVEALIRWNHPQYGFMSPDDFIPQAEQTGTIQKLTEYVLKTAIGRCASWQKSGFPLKIAVNLSVRDLLNRHLPGELERLLSEQGLDVDCLVLEITESAVMEDPEFSLSVLHGLHDKGFSLSIDDFGTGYSSMAYIKQLPIDELKIDKSFVTDLSRNREDEIIVRSTIEMGHNLGLKVIAEGIEDQESLELLQNFGCDMGQGYLFSKPLTSKDLLDWVRSSRWGLNEMTKQQKNVYKQL